MVTVYGMSEKLGPIFLGGDHEVFLGRDFSQPRSNFSEAVNAQVDEEIRALLQECNDRAAGILEEHRQQLEAVAEALIRHEKLDRAAFEAVVNGVTAETEDKEG